MAFIEKENPIVLNIKLTSRGRYLISKGNLNFAEYALGDSEMDYEYIDEYGIGSSDFNILRPKDRNPNIISFVKRNEDADDKNTLNTVPTNSWLVKNSVDDHGFFDISDEENIKIYDDLVHTKQNDCFINIKDVVGDDELRIRKSSSYGSNTNEPKIGDFLMVRWTNPNYNNTDNFTISVDDLHPVLFYRIEDIVAGNLYDDNLIVKVDRNLPDFSSYDGNNKAGVIVYSPEISLEGGSTYSTDFVEDAVFSFMENYNLPTKEVPFWNMSLVFTNDIAGVLESNKDLNQYKSTGYAGFVSYIQNHTKEIDNLGIIHYTNASPANTYGEGFYYDTPKLYMPTIMWHKDGGKMGLTLSCGDEYKKLDGLNIKYYDLVDQNNYVVGKVFNGLKIFIIEDPELLMAMSYKSNRNWTLPNYEIDINTKVSIGECVECTLNYDYDLTQPENIDDSGSITINNITMSDVSANLFVVLTNNDTDETTTDTYDENVEEFTYDNLDSGNYTITLYDLSAPDCLMSTDFTIEKPSSTLDITDVDFYEV